MGQTNVFDERNSWKTNNSYSHDIYKKIVAIWMVSDTEMDSRYGNEGFVLEEWRSYLVLLIYRWTSYDF